jgi:MSHA biogenesis protein MshG
VRLALESGIELSAAMAAHPAVFSEYMRSTVRVGETTGRLAEAFAGLHDQLSFERDNRNAVRAALRYPITVLVVIAAALTVVNIFVIPSFAKAYKGFKAELPLLTRLLVAISDFFVHFWPLLTVGLIGGTAALTLWTRTPAGRRVRDRLLLALPIIGPLLYKAALARFTKSFSVALGAGVPVVPALDAAVATTGNVVLATRIAQMKDGAHRGESLVRAARTTGAFAPVVLQMIAVGEETGALAEMMNEIADHFAREVDYAIKSLGAQLEPLLIVLLGGFVLVFALGVFLPMWDLGRVAIK